MWLRKSFDCILAFSYIGQRCEHDYEVNKLNLSSLNADREKSYSDQISHSVVSNSLRPHGLQHTRLPCPSLTPRACSDSCPSSWWCHPTISSSVIPFSSCLQSFPASGSFPVSQFFASGGQRIRPSASASVLPNEYSGLISSRIDWFDLLVVQGTLKSLPQHHSSKALILLCSVFFIVQLSHPYMTTGKTIALTWQTFVGKVMSLLFFFYVSVFFLIFIFIFLFVVDFIIHLNETAMGLHVFSIPIPPPTSLSTRSL